MRHPWLALMLALPAGLCGQDLGAVKLQFHGFVSQGGLLSSHNNYLTAKTSGGSTQWTEAAVNLSASISDDLRIGAQVHTYRLGELGQLKLDLDWAYGDYRLREWLGFRVGKVKTPLGLFNDTQDIDNLHLWALLPQGIYPADNRSWTLSHTGGDVYGRVGIADSLGELSYQGYYGSRTLDSNGGYFKQSKEFGLPVEDGAFGQLYGGDLRWNPPVHGLTAGASVGLAGMSGKVTLPNVPFQVTLQSTADTNTAMYAEYERGKFYAAGEFRRRIWDIAMPELHTDASAMDSRAWYVMSSYRVHPKVNVGAYYSHYTHKLFFAGVRVQPHSNDWVAAVRIDPNPYLYLKFEGHYIAGTALGLYRATNSGFDPLTRLLALKIGFSF